MKAGYGLLLLSLVSVANCQHPNGQALFIRGAPTAETEIAKQRYQERVSRQSEARMDQTVQGILKWLQGRYNQTSRRSRQNVPSFNYLPASPSTTQRPRPFQTTPSSLQVSYQPPLQSSSGYPYPQPSPVPTFNIPSNIPGSAPSYRPQQPSQSYLPSEPSSPSYPSPQPSPTYRPSAPSQPSGSYQPSAPVQPSDPTYTPSAPSQPSGPTYTPLAPSQPSGSYQPSQPSGPTYTPSAPSQPSGPTYTPSAPSQPSGPTYTPSIPSQSPGPSYTPSAPTQPSPPSYQPSGPSQQPTGPSQQPSGPTYQPSGPGQPTYEPGAPSQSGPGIQPSGPDTPIGPSAPSGPSGPGFPQQDIPIDNTIDNDESHPPHIHEINVQCGKDMMTIDIEFNRVFNGLIYSKGYFTSPECVFVRPNSGQTKYSITVTLNTCGTQFIDQFSEGKQAYLENVLVLQNDKDFQEVWDTTRSVRCYWEGNLKKQLTVALSVGALNQETVTFSGDTATAKLDIQLGKGPFAPAANGLVKIGETMTLVVTVEGDSAFNVLVRDCVARDNEPNSGNLVQLTDNKGCVLKPKLLGAFQMTKNPESNSVIAYAFFQAFKFPDIMDLTIECNVELCKTECAPCPNPNQKLEPGRRRRNADNSTIGLTDPVSVGRRLRVFMPDDLEETSAPAPMIINVGRLVEDGSYCLSSFTFLISSTMLLCILIASCISTAVLWLKLQKQYLLHTYK